MKRTVIFLLCVLQIFQMMVFAAAAENKEYHWYCVHVKGHRQPSVGTELAFVEELGGYYIDHNHTDVGDEDKVVYLTFDAGYENGNIEKILDILQEESVSGAFFILGHLIQKNTDLIKRMVSEGHTVCNHTVKHKNMCQMSDAEFIKELKELERLYKDAVGVEMAPYYRPPEGSFSKENLAAANKNGYKTIFWSFAYADWDNQNQTSPQKAKQVIMDNIHNGEIMLLHPTSSTNAAVLKDIICELKEMGYRFGTLDELTRGSSQ